MTRPMADHNEPNQARRLLTALYEQRAELGEVANELISLLTAAGLGDPERTDNDSGGSTPVDGVRAGNNGAN